MKARHCRMLIKLGVLLLLPFAVQQQGYAVTISNAEFVIRGFGGQVASSSFSIGNNEKEPLIIEIKVIDWHRDPFDALVFLEPNTHPRSIAHWIGFEPERFVLSPDTSQQINFTVAIPQEVTGSYWGGFLAEVKTESDAQQQEEGVGVRIGTRFLIKVFVEAQVGREPKGSLTSVRQLGLNPLTIAVSFANTGNTRLQDVRGRVEIRDLQGNTIKSMPIPEFTILPGDTREIQVVERTERGNTLPPGRYLALAIVDLGLDSLLGGQLIFDVNELNIVPIGNATNPPQDLDDDGFFEDVNGDGKFDPDDVEVLRDHLSSDAVQLNWRAFDFNNDGTVNAQDIATLIRLLG